MKLKPLGNQILVSPQKDDGILAQEQQFFLNYGTVEAIGPDVKTVQVGDMIAFTIWGLNHIDLDGVRYHLLPDNPDFLLGTIHEE